MKFNKLEVEIEAVSCFDVIGYRYVFLYRWENNILSSVYQNGIRKFYYPSGQIESIIFFDKEKKDLFYDQNGNLIY